MVIIRNEYKLPEIKDDNSKIDIINDLYEEQLVCYIDILGFGALTSSSSSVKREEIYDILSFISQNTSEFTARHIYGTFSPPGHEEGVVNQLQYGPTVSTFSDNIAISIPLNRIPDVYNGQNADKINLFFAFSTIKNIVIAIASRAILLGFSIRGGISIGKLFHKPGIIFGDALLESVELEKKYAIYPRIVLSQSLIEDNRFSFALNNECKLDHFDGRFHLDYMERMINEISEIKKITTTEAHKIITEIVHVRTQSASGLSAYIQAKWIWFGEYLKEFSVLSSK